MKKISLALSILLLVASCRKDTDVFHVDDEVIIGSSQWTGRISNFYAEVDDNAENFALDASFAATFKTAQQTEFHFSPNAFSTEAGVIVGGSINLEVAQLQSRGDLILNNISTLVDNQVMELTALYEISGLKGNLPLRLADDQNLQFTFPSDSPADNQQVLYGEAHQEGITLWPAQIQGIAPELSASEIFDETEDVWRLAVATQSSQLGWFGCAQVIEPASGTTSVCVNLPEGFNAFNSAVFLVFEDYWSVVKLEGSPGQQFCTDHIPVGTPVKLVSISERESGNFYLDFKDIAPAAGLENVVNLQPESMPLNEVMVWIESL